MGAHEDDVADQDLAEVRSALYRLGFEVGGLGSVLIGDVEVDIAAIARQGLPHFLDEMRGAEVLGAPPSILLGPQALPCIELDLELPGDAPAAFGADARSLAELEPRASAFGLASEAAPLSAPPVGIPGLDPWEQHMIADPFGDPFADAVFDPFADFEDDFEEPEDALVSELDGEVLGDRVDFEEPEFDPFDPELEQRLGLLKPHDLNQMLDDLLEAFPPEAFPPEAFTPEAFTPGAAEDGSGLADAEAEALDPPERRFLEFPEFGDAQERYLDPNVFPDFEDPDL